jgi:phytoene dehydrogenase-like protein
MSTPKLVIVGGGLAGLSAGCYARASGFDVTLVEHNIGLGGECTVWQRGPYLVDGCIHWLTGGPFQALYEELGIVPAVKLHTLEDFAAYRHARDGWQVTLRRDLERTLQAMREIAPEDGAELVRLGDGADRFAALDPEVLHPSELTSVSERMQRIWRLRHDVGAFVHFRTSIGEWVNEHLQSPRLRGLFVRLLPPEAPAMVLLFILGYLARGWLSRPIGGTAPFRDALIYRYRTLGGEALLDNTVEEVLETGGRARGVRLTDGTLLDADVVISTASAPETVFRLLAGRFGAAEWKARMDSWRMFQPIVLASFGVAKSLEGEPSTLLIDEIEPLTVGGYRNDHLYIRLYNDDPAFAPPGHTVVQTMVSTDYDWWAKRGAQYQREKEAAAAAVLASLDRQLPGLESSLRMTDLATPLTYWRNARAWRGAFEGWLPGANAFKHVPKQLPGLSRFYMAGQWVEPGGGVPTAIMSGRHAVQVMCVDLKREFTPPPV